MLAMPLTTGPLTSGHAHEAPPTWHVRTLDGGLYVAHADKNVHPHWAIEPVVQRMADAFNLALVIEDENGGSYTTLWPRVRHDW